ncbi:protease SohB [Halomonas halocynthiae]|uniref:protease SohB n=1 Tax=Halomonas halocynthiae TaxID=176290 RepID=UPI00041F2F39|nr:protease SohB [Halomonas halocynthiae]
MSEALQELAMFFVQLVLVAVVVGVLASHLLRRRDDGGAPGKLQLDDLNAQYDRRQKQLEKSVENQEKSEGWRKLTSWLKKRRNHNNSQNMNQAEDEAEARVWVLDFNGDMKASSAGRLGEEISALLGVASSNDEVVLRLESPGGLVHAYGHAAAELDRLKQAGISTTVCVDRVAASGGYLMACGADKLIAAPFAVLGSIGVIAQVPNIHRLLKRHDIDVELHTAGRYKRTLTLMGENDEAGREKFQEDLEVVHQLFKRYVAERRPALDIEQVASGESWHGSDALSLGLIDELGTSEQYLIDKLNNSRVTAVRLVERSTLASRLGMAVSLGVERGAQRVIESLDASGWHKR